MLQMLRIGGLGTGKARQLMKSYEIMMCFAKTPANLPPSASGFPCAPGWEDAEFGRRNDQTPGVGWLCSTGTEKYLNLILMKEKWNIHDLSIFDLAALHSLFMSMRTPLPSLPCKAPEAKLRASGNPCDPSITPSPHP